LACAYMFIWSYGVTPLFVLSNIDLKLMDCEHRRKFGIYPSAAILKRAFITFQQL